MRRFLRITQEAAFATFPGSPTSIYVRLDQPDAFKVMTKPEFWQIMSGSGFAVPALFGSQTSATRSDALDPARLRPSGFSLGLGWANNQQRSNVAVDNDGNRGRPRVVHDRIRLVEL